MVSRHYIVEGSEDSVIAPRSVPWHNFAVDFRLAPRYPSKSLISVIQRHAKYEFQEAEVHIRIVLRALSSQSTLPRASVNFCRSRMGSDKSTCSNNAATVAA